jgi:hypothetical protein
LFRAIAIQIIIRIIVIIIVIIIIVIIIIKQRLDWRKSRAKYHHHNNKLHHDKNKDKKTEFWQKPDLKRETQSEEQYGSGLGQLSQCAVVSSMKCIRGSKDYLEYFNELSFYVVASRARCVLFRVQINVHITLVNFLCIMYNTDVNIIIMDDNNSNNNNNILIKI